MSTSRPIALRIMPTQLATLRRPQAMLERHWMQNQAGGWWIVISGFFEPLLYLLSIQIGFSSLIGTVTDGGRTMTYAAFVGPALMASSAMNGAIYESTMNIFFQLKYDQVFDAAVATPLTPTDVAIGEISYCTLRGALYSVIFVGYLFALRIVSSPWALLTVPVCVLLAFTFSAIGMAVTTYMRDFGDFEFIPAAMLPMFLFSATFYPVSSYGSWAWAANLSPLYHGVVVCRGVSQGEFAWSYLAHLAVLVVLAIGGLAVTTRRFGRLLTR